MRCFWNGQKAVSRSLSAGGAAAACKQEFIVLQGKRQAQQRLQVIPLPALRKQAGLVQTGCASFTAQRCMLFPYAYAQDAAIGVIYTCSGNGRIWLGLYHTVFSAAYYYVKGFFAPPAYGFSVFRPVRGRKYFHIPLSVLRYQAQAAPFLCVCCDLNTPGIR